MATGGGAEATVGPVMAGPDAARFAARLRRRRRHMARVPAMPARQRRCHSAAASPTATDRAPSHAAPAIRRACRAAARRAVSVLRHTARAGAAVQRPARPMPRAAARMPRPVARSARPVLAMPRRAALAAGRTMPSRLRERGVRVLVEGDVEGEVPPRLGRLCLPPLVGVGSRGDLSRPAPRPPSEPRALRRPDDRGAAPPRAPEPAPRLAPRRPAPPRPEVPPHPAPPDAPPRVRPRFEVPAPPRLRPAAAVVRLRTVRRRCIAPPAARATTVAAAPASPADPAA